MLPNSFWQVAASLGVGAFAAGIFLAIVRRFGQPKGKGFETSKLGRRETFIVVVLIIVFSGIAVLAALVISALGDSRTAHTQSTLLCSGYVFDFSTQRPLRGVEVVMKTPTDFPRHTATDSEGFFQFSLIRKEGSSTARLRFERENYALYERTVELGGQHLPLDVRLRRTEETELAIVRGRSIIENPRNDGEAAAKQAIKILWESATQLDEQQRLFWGNVSVTLEGLDGRERRLNGLQPSIEALEEYLEEIKTFSREQDIDLSPLLVSSNRTTSIEEALEDLKNESRSSSDRLMNAIQSVGERDYDRLIDSLRLHGDQPGVGVIKSSDGIKMYRENEVEEFTRDAKSAVSKGGDVGFSADLGTQNGFDCWGLPRNCSSFVSPNRRVNDHDPVEWQIQWFTGPRSPSADRMLATLDRAKLTRSLSMFNGKICSWYYALGEMSWSGSNRNEKLNLPFLRSRVSHLSWSEKALQRLLWPAPGFESYNGDDLRWIRVLVEGR